MKANKVSLNEKFNLINEYWTPAIVGELNGQLVKLVKLKGEFIWHKHEKEDELFLVIEVKLSIQLRDKTIELQAGEFTIIPKGVEHKPIAVDEVMVMLFEPKSTLNTGNIQNQRTKSEIDCI